MWMTTVFIQISNGFNVRVFDNAMRNYNTAVDPTTLMEIFLNANYLLDLLVFM